MMRQFEVINGYLTVVDTSRWDYMWGFNRVIRKLK